MYLGGFNLQRLHHMRVSHRSCLFFLQVSESLQLGQSHDKATLWKGAQGNFQEFLCFLGNSCCCAVFLGGAGGLHLFLA